MLSGLSRDFSSSPLARRARFEHRKASRVVARTNAHERVSTGEREAIGGVVVERERASPENASREIDESMLFLSGHRTLKWCWHAPASWGVHGMPLVVFVSGSAVGPEAATERDWLTPARGR
ncbi:MAG: hypothetical protein KJ015_39410 [Myxococcales bacterium]|nr:hypothetical protein [Myxococcales bacterium]